MCGIAGVINASKVTVKELTGFVKDAILTGSVRGVDSVGLAAIDSLCSINVYKDILNPVSFLTAKPAASIIEDASDSYFTLIHHRAATVGKVTVAAAQPFYYVGEALDVAKTEFDVILCHNGTLSGGFDKKSGNITFDSDSDWLAWKVAQHLDADGVPNFDEVFRGVTGSWSIVCTVAGITYMLNNGDRPMHVAWAANDQFALFASEPGMLGWIAERNGIKIKNTEIHKLKPDTVYSFDFLSEAGKVSVSAKPFTKTYKVTSTTSHSGSTSSYKNPLDTLYEKVTASVPPPPPASTTPTTLSNVARLVPPSTFPTATKELAGKQVEFMINDIDEGLSVAFGTCWLLDDNGMDILSRESKTVLESSSCMLDISEVADGAVSLYTSSLFAAPIKSIRSISESRNGALQSVPHLHLDGTKLRIVESDISTSYNNSQLLATM